MATVRHVPGDWGKAVKKLRGLVALQEQNQKIARKASATYARDRVRQTINEGRPEWPALKPATIARKKSSKPLVRHADLLANITESDQRDFHFVGVLRTAKNRDGDDLVDIGAVQEYGSEKAGVPPRSFIRTTFNEIRGDLAAIHVKAAESTLKGRKFSLGK